MDVYFSKERVMKMADTLTDKGIGTMTGGTFMADMAQFFSLRQENIDKTYPGLSHTSSEYRDCQNNIHYKTEKLKACLPKDLHIELNLICEEYTALVNINNSLYYRQGFSDGVKMILQSLMLR